MCVSGYNSYHRFFTSSRKYSLMSIYSKKITNYIFHTLKKVLINLEEQKKEKWENQEIFPLKLF